MLLSGARVDQTEGRASAKGLRQGQLDKDTEHKEAMVEPREGGGERSSGRELTLLGLTI